MNLRGLSAHFFFARPSRHVFLWDGISYVLLCSDAQEVTHSFENIPLCRLFSRGRLHSLEATAKSTSCINPQVKKMVHFWEPVGRIPGVPLGRSRKSGAGRKPLVGRDPQILGELDRLVDPDTRGDPMSPLRWTCKSTRQLAEALRDGGHPISHRLVGELLASMGYS
ncbi:MAG: hypothetical protein IT167_05610, partial [Bryobacterales bacterium]|nr:hypothetical protein [Bryobacterales bacterium]